LNSGRTLPELRKELDSEGPAVSFAAAKAFWTLNDPLGWEAWIYVLDGDKKTPSGFITKQKREALRMRDILR
jgi:hypothetical protein